jgi:hypothetical protein
LLVSVNKKIKSGSRKPVKYAALSSALNAATSSGVWMDDESGSGDAKRQNRIRVSTRPIAKPAIEQRPQA